MTDRQLIQRLVASGLVSMRDCQINTDRLMRMLVEYWWEGKEE